MLKIVLKTSVLISLTSDLSLFLDSFSLSLCSDVSSLCPEVFFFSISWWLFLQYTRCLLFPWIFLSLSGWFFFLSCWLSLYPDGSYSIYILIVRPSKRFCLSIPEDLSFYPDLSLYLYGICLYYMAFFSIPEYFSIMITYLYILMAYLSIKWYSHTILSLSISMFPSFSSLSGHFTVVRLTDHTPKLHITIFIVKIILSSWF